MPDELSRAMRPSIPPTTPDRGGVPPDRASVPSRQATPANPERTAPANDLAEGSEPGWVIETVVSPFHCLYQDALHFHTQSKLALARSESEASRLARAAVVLYLASAEALVHQAVAELGRPEVGSLLADPSRPLPTAEVWRLL